MEDIASRLRRLPEPQCSPCQEAAAEIQMLRQQWREMSSAIMELRRENLHLKQEAIMELRRENLHLKQELADSKRWAMSERAAKLDALAKQQ